jgi:hypothetical protein
MNPWAKANVWPAITDTQRQVDPCLKTIRPFFASHVMTGRNMPTLLKLINRQKKDSAWIVMLRISLREKAYS